METMQQELDSIQAKGIELDATTTPKQTLRSKPSKSASKRRTPRTPAHLPERESSSEHLSTPTSGSTKAASARSNLFHSGKKSIPRTPSSRRSMPLIGQDSDSSQANSQPTTPHVANWSPKPQQDKARSSGASGLQKSMPKTNACQPGKNPVQTKRKDSRHTSAKGTVPSQSQHKKRTHQPPKKRRTVEEEDDDDWSSMFGF
eukprot:m.215769 g.215769  ORF g.215769 m.215769 type:complete len:202 (-) comp26214_c1_seq2:113-718(-)